jgi:PAS domain S-box-containing protein
MPSAHNDAGGVAQNVATRDLGLCYERLLTEANPDALFAISPEGAIACVNEGTLRLTGMARDALIGTDFSAWFTDPALARDLCPAADTNGAVYNYPLVLRRRNGDLIDVLFSAGAWRDAGGTIRGVCASGRDVTEAMRLNLEFAETRNDLNNILQSSIRYSIIGKDLDRRILSWNEGALQNYRYTAAEVVGLDSSMLHTPEDRASGAVTDLMATAYETGFAEGEFERVRKDGSRFWANVAVTRRTDAAGTPTGYLVMSNDISERKRAEEQARSTSQYARSLIEASLDPFVTVSPEGKIADVNEATAKITGVPREQLVGSDFSSYFTRPELAREGYRQVFARGSITDYPLTIRHRNQTLTEVMYNATVYEDVQGDLLGVFCARDMTSLRRAEADVAEQRNKELDRLAELERFQKLTVGRELKMIELKKEIQDLKQQVPQSAAE